MLKRVILSIVLVMLAGVAVQGDDLAQSFRDPPDSAKPWVFWFWINGNISREGITQDLEAMKRVGINGVLWMEVSGPWWAPQGKVEAGTEAWDEAMQWAISEADRLGMQMALSVDFGYGCGGPHITPDKSMQKLVWTTTPVTGGQPVSITLKKPAVDPAPMLKNVWLRPGEELDPRVLKTIEGVDSYRDIAVFALKTPEGKAPKEVGVKKATYRTLDGRVAVDVTRFVKKMLATRKPLTVDFKKLGGDPAKGIVKELVVEFVRDGKPGTAQARDFQTLDLFGGEAARIDDTLLPAYDGRGWKTHLPDLSARGAPLPGEDDIDLTTKMGAEGALKWSPPAGDWQVIRLGHCSNFKMTRPCPRAAVGLECDRLNPHGIDAHFEHHLKPILEAAGDRAGRTLKYIHIDSWEAGGQNWSAGFADAFKQRRGYDIHPWLPAYTGRIVRDAELTGRFFWDVRLTVSELMLEHYIDRLRELAAPYGVHFSSESYGHFCVDDLTYGGRADFPIAEFWTEKQFGKTASEPPATFGQYRNPAIMDGYCFGTMKAQASVANTYGRPRVGAEAFTGARAWGDHPWLLKGMGDEAFAHGINHYIYHLSAHQPYDNMVPGLTHRKWGQHIHRHQTWWEYSGPYFEYVARCQALLRQGRTVADIACLFKEGAPIDTMKRDVSFNCPPGHDFDYCTPEIIQRMEVRNGRIHLPSGASYRYLALPEDGCLTLTTAQKIESLRRAGAAIYQQRRIMGTPGLTGYPEADQKVRNLAGNWPCLPKDGWNAVMAEDGLKPDFEGQDLHWIHRRSGSDDVYFVASSKQEPVKRDCVFRVAGRHAELWNPETGAIHALPTEPSGGRTRAPLHFGPCQSWFVVFRDRPSSGVEKGPPFPVLKNVMDIDGAWNLSFDPKWGSEKALKLDRLNSWSEHSDPLVKYYSGTATYRTTFDFDAAGDSPGTRACLDLGNVAVVARVKLNGKDCGIAWKPPYRVDVSEALKTGRNTLEIEVANTWVNRLIGDEQLPLDSEWHNWETLKEWPDWFKAQSDRPSGRYTFTSARHYTGNSEPHPAGLLGPVRIVVSQ